MGGSYPRENGAVLMVQADVDLFQLVLPTPAMPLAGWYAAPLEQNVAVQLQMQARQSQQRQLAGHGSLFAARLAELIAGYWLGRAVVLDYRSLLVAAPTELRALVELTYGQLLISRKLAGAQEHLRSGFTLAAPILEPAEYFTVLRRHELLSSLVLTATPAAAQTLSDLLNEARVIKQLQPKGRRIQPPHNDDDTLG